MIKKYQKKVSFIIFCLIFLYAGLFCLSIHKVLAADLEIQYPTISGQTITAETKLPGYMNYLFNAGMLLGSFAVFISLVIAGVMYFLSPVSVDMQSAARDRVSGAISGLLILVLTYLITTTINPQLNIFTLHELPAVTAPPVATVSLGGIYFYNNGACPIAEGPQANTTSIGDLGLLKNRINSVGVVRGGDNGAAYISILYDNINFWGKCQYINPNQPCNPVSPFAASASIHAYNFNSDGDGVYFYRKSCFNDGPYNNVNNIVAHCNSNSGGYLKISNKDIGKLYIGNLNSLRFTSVPEEEQACIQYNKSGACVGKSPQSLGGENISSMIINGNYLVLLLYKGPGDNPAGPWTSCQEFPTNADINKLGPRQIKWQNIRNSGGVVPNYVAIIPIQG